MPESPEQPVLLTAPTTPGGVLRVIHAATCEDLLSDTESLAAGLVQAGWCRAASGGMWVYRADPAWTIQSEVDPPDLSIFATGPDDVVAAAAEGMAEHLLGDKALGLSVGEPDPGWRAWVTSAVEVTLYFSPSRTMDLPDMTIEMPCLLQLAFRRRDASPHRAAPDPERARRLAREGSAVQRWYLAAQDDLLDDVIQLLGEDEDPAVVAALEAGASQRRLRREQAAAGLEP